MANWYDKYLSIYGKSPDEIPESILNEIKEKLAEKQCKEPLVSVVVIAYNEERHLPACLWSLSELQSQYLIEILGVNNNSKDLNLSKKESTISNISSVTNSSITSKESKKEEKEKPAFNLKDINNLKAYPKIDYGKKYTDNNDEKPTISIVIIGHVDSGKSTII